MDPTLKCSIIKLPNTDTEKTDIHHNGIVCSTQNHGPLLKGQGHTWESVLQNLCLERNIHMQGGIQI
jgi:hypothetical protein